MSLTAPLDTHNRNLFYQNVLTSPPEDKLSHLVGHTRPNTSFYHVRTPPKTTDLDTKNTIASDTDLQETYFDFTNFMFFMDFVLPTIIFILGNILNPIAIFIFFQRRLRRHSHSVYLTALCLSDEIYCLVSLLHIIEGFSGVSLINYHVMCQATTFLLHWAATMSPWSLAMFTIERCYVVCFPLSRQKLTVTLMRRFMILCCLTICAIHGPFIYFVRSTPQGCQSYTNSTTVMKLSQTREYVFNFIIPCLIIVVLNAVIFVRCYRASNRRKVMSNGKVDVEKLENPKSCDSLSLLSPKPKPLRQHSLPHDMNILKRKPRSPKPSISNGPEVALKPPFAVNTTRSLIPQTFFPVSTIDEVEDEGENSSKNPSSGLNPSILQRCKSPKRDSLRKQVLKLSPVNSNAEERVEAMESLRIEQKFNQSVKTRVVQKLSRGSLRLKKKFLEVPASVKKTKVEAIAQSPSPEACDLEEPQGSEGNNVIIVSDASSAESNQSLFDVPSPSPTPHQQSMKNFCSFDSELSTQSLYGSQPMKKLSSGYSRSSLNLPKAPKDTKCFTKTSSYSLAAGQNNATATNETSRSRSSTNATADSSSPSACSDFIKKCPLSPTSPMSLRSGKSGREGTGVLCGRLDSIESCPVFQFRSVTNSRGSQCRFFKDGSLDFDGRYHYRKQGSVDSDGVIFQTSRRVTLLKRMRSIYKSLDSVEFTSKLNKRTSDLNNHAMVLARRAVKLWREKTKVKTLLILFTLSTIYMIFNIPFYVSSICSTPQNFAGRMFFRISYLLYVLQFSTHVIVYGFTHRLFKSEIRILIRRSWFYRRFLKRFENRLCVRRQRRNRRPKLTGIPKRTRKFAFLEPLLDNPLAVG